MTLSRVRYEVATIHRGVPAIALDVIQPVAMTRPEPGPRRLCVGMATFDDFDGVWFTIQAIRMYQSEVLADLSFVVIDNHPDGLAAGTLKALGDWVPHYRYVPF